MATNSTSIPSSAVATGDDYRDSNTTNTKPSIILSSAGNASLIHRPVPILPPDSVSIRIAYTGVCGSDVHFWTQGGMGHKVDPAHPVVMTIMSRACRARWHDTLSFRRISVLCCLTMWVWMRGRWLNR